MQKEKEMAALLEGVSQSMRELGELEQSYKAKREEVTRGIRNSVFRLAQMTESQAERAHVVRELYWNSTVSAEVIRDAFKLTIYRMLQIAGGLTTKIACAEGCGRPITVTYAS